MQCANKLKQIGLALGAYENNFGEYPAARAGCDGSQESGASVPCKFNYQAVGTSGLVAILPFIEQQAVYDMFDFTDGPWTYNNTWYLGTNASAIAQRPKVFVCPSDESKPFSDEPGIGASWPMIDSPAATGSYALCSGSLGGAVEGWKYGNNGIFYYRDSLAVSDVTDGLSGTMLAGEVIRTVIEFK